MSLRCCFFHITLTWILISDTFLRLSSRKSKLWGPVHPCKAPQSRQMLKASQSFPCSGTLFKTKHDEIEASWIQTCHTLQAAIAAFHSLVKRKLGRAQSWSTHASGTRCVESTWINQLNGHPVLKQPIPAVTHHSLNPKPCILQNSCFRGHRKCWWCLQNCPLRRLGLQLRRNMPCRTFQSWF